MKIFAITVVLALFATSALAQEAATTRQSPAKTLPTTFTAVWTGVGYMSGNDLLANVLFANMVNRDGEVRGAVSLSVNKGYAPVSCGGEKPFSGTFDGSVLKGSTPLNDRCPVVVRGLEKQPDGSYRGVVEIGRASGEASVRL